MLLDELEREAVVAVVGLLLATELELELELDEGSLEEELDDAGGVEEDVAGVVVVLVELDIVNCLKTSFAGCLSIAHRQQISQAMLCCD